MKPQFEHDCDKCEFLGRIERRMEAKPDFMPKDEDMYALVAEFTSVVHYDLFFCVKQPTGSTVIARYGSNDHEYKSGMVFADGMDPDLTIAKRMAQMKGLM